MKFTLIEETTVPINRFITKLKQHYDDWREFRWGACWEFASALQKIYDGDIYGIKMYYEEDGKIKMWTQVRHAYLFYKGKYWDIYGSHSSKDIMIDYWKKAQSKDERDRFFGDTHIQDFKLEKIKPMKVSKDTYEIFRDIFYILGD